ncbi:phosphoglycerate dehydrogenase [Paenibacillus lactis]|uniref:phosphoglycerate dehydrogenase n=1 Tax=Paenibacillus lactis TaxID=228574 RepID=UPI001B2DFEF0|nr:phosphoglycerate dehydrogenase [Paenibacillus lactis]GIO89951.1 2-hydroxyacid dehydrogenase [Paenibacillus lactis]
MGRKVLATPRSFGTGSQGAADLLARRGFDLRLNPYGRILTKAEMIREIRDAEAVIVGVDPLDREVLSQAERLKLISKYGVGTDNIDAAYAAQRGIRITTTVGANTEAVADYAFTLMLAAARRVIPIDRACRRGDWNKTLTVDVHGSTLGLIGLGHIGKAVARRAKGFDMKIMAYDHLRDEDFAVRHGITYVDTLQTLIEQADFVSLHLPLNEHTRHLIGPREFETMKKTAVLINTARGGLIDETAMVKALKAGRIWGAGLDVFEREPPDLEDLHTLDNLVIGSHCAASTRHAVENMGMMAVRNVIQHLCGEEG